MAQLQVVDEALPPDSPLPRKRLETIALGLASGLILAILVALAWASRPRIPWGSRQV
jgi:uncharacterized protein involved in exopolysaccharide biosynthesis